MESNLCKKIFASENNFIKRLFKRSAFHSPPQHALGLRKSREYLPRVLLCLQHLRWNLSR